MSLGKGCCFHIDIILWRQGGIDFNQVIAQSVTKEPGNFLLFNALQVELSAEQLDGQSAVKL
jgi:hypothetical protein